VAHGGQKSALGFAGGFRGFLGFFQFSFGALVFGNVRGQTQEELRLPGGIREQGEFETSEHLSTVAQDITFVEMNVTEPGG